MRGHLAAALLGLAVAVGAIAPAAARSTASCANISKVAVAALFERWNASLRTLDPDAVVRNYAADAVLLPTLSNRPRLTQAERRDYFVHFLAGRPIGHIDQHVIRLGCNDAIDTGLYTFAFADGRQVHARYTFTYVLRGRRWLISSHHSSLMPERDGAAE